MVTLRNQVIFGSFTVFILYHDSQRPLVLHKSTLYRVVFFLL